MTSFGVLNQPKKLVRRKMSKRVTLTDIDTEVLLEVLAYALKESPGYGLSSKIAMNDLYRVARKLDINFSNKYSSRYLVKGNNETN